jgi:hypothetical protein
VCRAGRTVYIVFGPCHHPGWVRRVTTEIDTTWLGLAGPGVQHQGVHLDTLEASTVALASSSPGDTTYNTNENAARSAGLIGAAHRLLATAAAL